MKDDNPLFWEYYEPVTSEQNFKVYPPAGYGIIEVGTFNTYNRGLIIVTIRDKNGVTTRELGGIRLKSAHEWGFDRVEGVRIKPGDYINLSFNDFETGDANMVSCHWQYRLM